jgi:carboxylesterase
MQNPFMVKKIVPAEACADFFARGQGENSRIGILLIHGFTGNPSSLLPWGKFLAAKGYTVSIPLLPGHGTEWEELNKIKYQAWIEKAHKSLMNLRESCDQIFIFGLSMGGGLSCRIIEIEAENGRAINGAILVNPMIHIPGIAIKFGRIITLFKKSRPAVGDDIRKPGVSEYSYDALPLVGVRELHKMLKTTRKKLDLITNPIMLFHSVQDHVLPISNSDIIENEVSSQKFRRFELTSSYHVATLDYDQEFIFNNSIIFINQNLR